MKKELLKQDFYEAINGQWIEKHKIPQHKTTIGSFSDIDEKLETIKNKLLKKWQEDSNDIKDNKHLLEMIKYFSLFNNWNERKINGVKPAIEILNFINNLKDWKDVEKNYSKLTHWGLKTPIPFWVGTDFKNSDIENLYLSDPSTILPEKNYYANEDKKKNLQALWSAMVEKLLVKFNKNEKQNKELIAKALKWDELAAQYILSAEESAIYTNLYHPKAIQYVKETIKLLDVDKIVNNLVNQNVETIIAVDDNLVENYNKLITNENFELYKAYLYIETMLFLAKFLDYNSLVIAGEFNRAIVGQKKPLSKQKTAIRAVADGTFSMPFGKYYGEMYFGPKNKETVEKMVQSMVNIYKHRLENNTWLSSKTREKAILKLNKISVHVGYPEKYESFYNKLIVKKYNGFDDLLQNSLEFNLQASIYSFSKYMKKIDKNFWGMSPAVVNAYYSPSQNKIVFPAAILQAPFYNEKQSSSVNYGGIGAVIAHEISHAFDNNGANFDENGNMENWWTDEDKKQFELKAKKMIELFDGEETSVGRCNGKLTVSENIADAGGLSCALESAKLEKDYNPKKFYINFATIWRIKRRDEIARLLLDIDVHAPAKLRANIQIKNSDDFYKTFKITNKDPMYLAPKKRVKIW
ncbi:M13 family metallopeptidase [Metamycoplasma equirhinis]|uniref:M13 family metallopeptidase n=1 Tax=Metamycoplasma equirhinis TaxID=92402 RepID=UPI00359412E3